MTGDYFVLKKALARLGIIFLLVWQNFTPQLGAQDLQQEQEPGSSFHILPREYGEPLLPSLRVKAMAMPEWPQERVSWEEFLKDYRPFTSTDLRYRSVRRSIDNEGKPLAHFETIEQAIQKELAIPEKLLPEIAPPKPKPAELEIPEWQGKVNIAGRKLIGLNLETKKFLNPDHPLRPRSAPKTNFELKQELQLRVQGNVSDRVMVNVDYDDTKENKRDISIVYKGAPGEAVKEISFGDISLTLPQTQFTSYSKQLFGIKGQFDFKRARLMTVGSQSKGTFAIKRFSGQFQFESKEIADTAYIRRAYYNIAFDPAHLPPKPGSAVVYRDDRNAVNDANAQTITVGDYAVPAAQYTGKFDILVAGIDYIIDTQRGILRFTSEQPSNAVIAIDYITAQGTQLSSLGNGLPKVIKTDGDNAINGGDCAASGHAGCAREMKTFYSINRTKIMRDDGTGNFILKILEKGSRKDVSSDLGVKYPDNILIDFETGSFELLKPIPDSGIYQNSPISKYFFSLEYRFVLKTYLLQPNIVLQSEKVYQNGQQLTRDVDYYIDYDSGFISFTHPESITPQTEIEITYEVAPFGGQLSETLIGARGEVDLLQNVNLIGLRFSRLSLGSSVLLQQAAKPATIPDVRSLPASYSVYEGDVHLTEFKIPGPLKLTTNFHGEMAQSIRNPNTFKKALIESMEGIKLEDAASLNSNFWKRAANPSGEPSPFNAMTMGHESVPIKEINPNFTENDVQEVLAVNYDLTQSSSASIAYVFSPVGLDFTNKENFELALLGDSISGAPAVTFHLGKVNEDADADSLLDTEDKNSDGGLNFGEDTGWTYNNPDGSGAQIGSGNGRLDSEDFDANGRLDTDDPFIGGSFGLTAGASSTPVNFTNWITTSIPLGITSANQAKWVSIKVLRVTLTKTPGGKDKGTIKIAKLAATGSRWERPAISVASSDTFRIGPINNVDNPEYVPLFAAGGEVQDTYDELYSGSQQSALTKITDTRREQALKILLKGFQSSPVNPASGSTRLPFTRAVDLQTHKVLAFFFKGPSSVLPAGATFFFQFGSANDYFEYRMPMDTANVGSSWRLIKINLVDLNKDGRVDIAEPANYPELSASVMRQGNPNLSSVSQILMGLRLNSGAQAVNGEIWVNDIFLTEPREKKGLAQFMAMDFDLPGWSRFGFHYKTYDQEFEGLGQAVLNQALTERHGFANISRLKFLPVNAQATRTETITPSAIQTGPGNLVSQLAEGRVENLQTGANGSLNIPAIPGMRFIPIIKGLPSVNWSGSRGIADNTTTGRLEDTRNYSGSFSWSRPLGLKPINTLSSSYSRRDYRLSFLQSLRLQGSDNLNEIADTYESRLSIDLLHGRLNLSPGYRLNTVNETRETLHPDESVSKKIYPKSLTQAVNLTTSLRIFSWFAPSANFSSNIQENHRVEASTITIPGISTATAQFSRGDLKSINRQASLSLSQNFDFGQLLPWSRLLRTFSHSVNYNTTDGDTYENVIKDFQSNNKLWVRAPLEPSNVGARRTNLTLRDTISVNSRWSPFLGYFPASPWSTFSLSNTYNRNFERREALGTASRSLSLTLPDVVLSLSQLERIFGTYKWMSSAQINSKYSLIRKTNFDIETSKDASVGGDIHFIIKQAYDMTFSYNESKGTTLNLLTNNLTRNQNSQGGSAQIGFNWRLWRVTAKVDFSETKAVDAIGRLTQDQQTMAPAISARGDFDLPAGLRLPFSSKRMTFTNRLILTSGLKLERKSSLLNIEQTNTDNWDWNLSGDFQIGKNLRASLGSGFQLFQNRVLKDQDFYAFRINTQIIFQF